MNREQIHIISLIKKCNLALDDVPEGLENDFEIVKAEREYGIREIIRQGYDVIRNCFFAEEAVNYIDSESCSGPPMRFTDFSLYYDYMQGDIYSNSCFFQADKSKLPDNIDYKRLFRRQSFIDYSAEDFVLFPTKEEQKNTMKWMSEKTQ